MSDRPLSAACQAALARAQFVPIAPDDRTHRNTIAALERRMLVSAVYTGNEDAPDGIEWAITDAGRAELRREQPRFLAAGSSAIVSYVTLANGRQMAVDADDDPLTERGYTQRPDKAMPGEPEAVDPATIDGWNRQSTILHAASVRPDDRQAIDARIAELRAQGRRRQVDLSDDLRVIARLLLAGRVTPQVHRRIDAMERKVGHRAA